MMNVSIYSLTDPRTGQVRYVGKTQQRPINRLHRHLVRARSGSKSNVCVWLRSLLEEGLRPELSVLQVVSGPKGSETEKFWIEHFILAGAILTNMTHGGYGSLGYQHSEESKAKIRAARARQVFTQEQRAARSRYNKENGIRPPSNNAEILRGRPGQKHSEESRMKISQALLGNQNARKSLSGPVPPTV